MNSARYEYSSRRAQPNDVQRLQRLAERGVRFVARRGGAWGEAAKRQDRLERTLRGEPHVAIYEMEPRYHADRREIPDVVLTLKVPSVPVQADADNSTAPAQTEPEAESVTGTKVRGSLNTGGGV